LTVGYDEINTEEVLVAAQEAVASLEVKVRVRRISLGCCGPSTHCAVCRPAWLQEEKVKDGKKALARPSAPPELIKLEDPIVPAWRRRMDGPGRGRLLKPPFTIDLTTGPRDK
jgi:hypothetical protein